MAMYLACNIENNKNHRFNYCKLNSAGSCNITTVLDGN